MDSNPNPLTDGQTKHAITCQGEAFLLLRTGGTDTEIGRAIGEATAGDIGEMWEQFTAPRLVPQYGTPLERVGETCAWLRRNLEQICPWMAEQIDGIAEGSGLAREQVWIMNHYGVLWSAHGLFCTSLAVAESDHGPLLAQNLDIGAEDFYFVSCTRPTGGYAVLSDRMCAMCWSPTGINERGLAVGSSNLPRHGADVEKPLPPGVANHFIPHMVLRSCANVSEAVVIAKPPVLPSKVNTSPPATKSSTHYALAKRSGKVKKQQEILSELSMDKICRRKTTSGIFGKNTLKNTDRSLENTYKKQVWISEDECFFLFYAH